MVTRLQPAMGVGSYKTYQMLAPVATHFRPASCEDAGCIHYLNGWITQIDEATDQGAAQAAYIRRNSGRKFSEDRNELGLTQFTFAPGQQCFRGTEHRVRMDLPEIFVVRGGDWRGNPRGEVRRHANGDDWVDDFRNHQDQIASAIEEG